MGMELKQSPTGGLQFWDDASGGQAAAVLAITFAVNRAPTNTALVGILPANAQILRIDVIVPVVSNAGTTANVSIGLSGGSNTTFNAAQDVKTGLGTFSQTATAGWVASGVLQKLSCTYTETGTASTTGNISVAIYYAVN